MMKREMAAMVMDFQIFYILFDLGNAITSKVLSKTLNSLYKMAKPMMRKFMNQDYHNDCFADNNDF